FCFFSSRRRHTRSKRDWSSDVCSSDLCISLSTVDALATVTPISSLISCAYICLFERKTFKRGHSSVPNTRFRTRRCLCLRASFFVTLVIIYRHSLLHMY